MNDLENASELMTIDEVTEYLKVSRQQVYRLQRLANFPKGYNVSGGNKKTPRWVKKDIKNWLMSRQLSGEENA
jgi:predicted DNA-binding transcriptional regulator AlpA